MNTSKIEWTEATWSPVIGCTKVSAGCKHCYAEREVETRWSKNPRSIWYGRNFTDVLCRPEAIAGAGSPLRWKKPRRIFVCPRADLFHDDVPDLFIADVFGVMAATPQHTYQVLTKRPERARKLIDTARCDDFKAAVAECAAMYSDADVSWPLPNVHLGVSIEDQPSADERIRELLQTPAAVRWVSAEPLLGAVDLRPYMPNRLWDGLPSWEHPELDWVVGGFESGPNARPGHPLWARLLRDQCRDAGVPFLWKQNGEWVPRSACYHTFDDGKSCADHDPGAKKWPCVRLTETGLDGRDLENEDGGDDVYMQRVGKHRAGRLLDGVLHDAYPEVRP